VSEKSVMGMRTFPFRGVTRIALVIGLIAFVLPFATVSCGSQHVLTATGLNGITGARYAATGPAQSYSGNVAFLLALLAGVVALVILFLPIQVRVRAGAAGLASLWSAAMLLVGQAHVNAELADSNPNGLVIVRWEVGFWIALLAFSASAAMMALDLYRARSIPAGQPVPRIFSLPQTAPRSLLVTAGGLVALVGSMMIIVACELPFIHYTDSSIQPTSPSIMNPGFAPSSWFAAEPIGVAVLALIAAVGLVMWQRAIPRAIAASVLLAYGVQTSLLFLGYLVLAVKSPSAELTPADAIGVIAGVLLFAGGLAAMITLISHSPAAVQGLPSSPG
jgi:hypothetical protein